jgi:hypothetical protein
VEYPVPAASAGLGPNRRADYRAESAETRLDARIDIRTAESGRTAS